MSTKVEFISFDQRVEEKKIKKLENALDHMKPKKSFNEVYEEISAMIPEDKQKDFHDLIFRRIH